MSRIFLEGGGESKELQIRCREGFRKLLDKSGYAKRMPRTTARGGRDGAFKDFRIAHEDGAASEFVAMMIDSEDPVSDIEETWEHLRKHDNWQRPTNAGNDQVLFMTTCMETWILCDRDTLSDHYGAKLQKSALPSLTNIESRSRHLIQEDLFHSTRNCSNAYEKGKRSYEIVGKINPDILHEYLPSFARIRRILDARL